MNSTNFPARHGAEPEAWQAFIRPLKALFIGRRLPDQALCDAYGQALLRGDEPMDRLLDWMHDFGMGKARPLFEQALAQGIDSLQSPPPELQRFFSRIDQAPDWLDQDLLLRGAQAYALLGGDAFYAARDFVLMGGYLSSSINEVLYRAGGLERGANRRIAETADWYFRMTEPGAMARFGDGFKSTIHVRFVHAIVRRRLRAAPDWSTAADGLPLNQTDMVATWLGGSLAAFLGALLLGRLTISYADLRAVMHLFRYSHWLMGVEDQFLTDDPREAAYRLANLVLMQPGPTEVCVKMANALAEQPMDMEFEHFADLRRRWRRHKHLSRNRYFLWGKGMQQLGLPKVLPWYPLLTSPPKAGYYALRRFVLPGQRNKLAQHGRAEQRRLLGELYGSQQQVINPEQFARKTA